MSLIDIKLVAESRRRTEKPRAATLLNARCIDEAGHECIVRVRNLSELGLGGKITAGSAPRLDDDVALVLRSQKRIYGKVVRIARGDIGVAFDLPFEMDSLASVWHGPAFEVADLHANVGSEHRRPRLSPK